MDYRAPHADLRVLATQPSPIPALTKLLKARISPRARDLRAGQVAQ